MLEIVATLIGFAGIMLLLSLVVTGIVQWLQSFGFRERSLRQGLDELLDTVLSSEQRERLDGKRVLAQPRILGSGRTEAAKESRTWITQPELLDILDEHGVDDSARDAAAALFPRMEAITSKRFLLNVRRLTFYCAFVVAFVFQVGTPDLLRRLSTDPEYRARAVEVAEAAHGSAAAQFARDEAYRDAANGVLVAMAEKHADRAAVIEDHSASGSNKTELLAEMHDVLVAEPADVRRDLVAEFERRLDEVVGPAAATDRSADLLARVEVGAWSGGWAYYWDRGPRIGNLLGVLATAILLCFGAPFWFEMLGRLTKLRDLLDPSARKKTEDRGDGAG